MAIHHTLRGIGIGVQSTAGTPADPLPQLRDNLTQRRARMLAALQRDQTALPAHIRDQQLYGAWAANPPPVDPVSAPQAQYRTGGFTVAGDPPVYVSPADPAWHPVPADPWAPAAPRAYRYSGAARARKALFVGAPGAGRARCGQALDDCEVVAVAPPGLPRTVVHLRCLEAGDAVQPRPEAP